jgi:serine/threonine-protein kinase RIO1
LSPEQTKIVRDSTSSYLLNWNSAKLVLVHGDLGAGNWLFDKIQHTYAVIDWSDSCFAPQEFQMYRLITDYPEKINEIIQLFEGRSGRRINRDLIFDCGVLSICSRIAECMERAPLTVDIKIQELEAWSNLSL